VTTVSKVDPSGARLNALMGVDTLLGAIVGHDQPLDLTRSRAARSSPCNSGGARRVNSV
jgi:hypothetical protein